MFSSQCCNVRQNTLMSKDDDMKLLHAKMQYRPKRIFAVFVRLVAIIVTLVLNGVGRGSLFLDLTRPTQTVVRPDPMF